MFRVEMAKAARRWRTWVLAAGFVAIPTLIVVALVLTSEPPEPGEGPPFLRLVEINGVFASLVGLSVIQPFFLPLATGLLAGDAIAGESSAGTLRYLLVRPVGRVRLLGFKYVSVVTQVVAAVVIVALTGLAVGGLAYGIGPLPTLSGTTLAVGPALLRVAGAGLYIALGMAGLVAIGLLFSTLTDSGPGATAATVGIYIVMEVLDALPALRIIHPYLLSHHAMAFADLFRSPIALDGIARGVVVDAGYILVFFALTAMLFSRKDVTS
ncbi:MAG: ABC transporter permease subunit [Actinobacteria bacterium]|nr:ABC transporter permease subunit [Actinomycetota bacterium]